jgi:hypothetical protein
MTALVRKGIYSQSAEALMPQKYSTPTTRAAGRPRAAPTSARTAVLGSLDEAACHALLARHVVGRLAFSHHHRVEIEPIHYVYEAGWILWTHVTRFEDPGAGTQSVGGVRSG